MDSGKTYECPSCGETLHRWHGYFYCDLHGRFSVSVDGEVSFVFDQSPPYCECPLCKDPYKISSADSKKLEEMLRKKMKAEKG